MIKRTLHLSINLILWLNILLCLAILLSYFARFTNPANDWVVAFFGLAYPLLLVSNLLLIIYWLLRRKWCVFLSVISIAAGWGVLQNNIGFNSHGNDTGKLADGSMIRMMTYNVHSFKRYGSKNDISTKHDILEIINRQQPDIIGFQEFYSRKHGQYDMEDSILRIMGSTYHYFQPLIYNSDEAIGIAIFSKFPITAHGLVSIVDTRSENACIYVDVVKGNKQFRVYNVHLQSIRFEPEDYQYIKGITHDGADMSSTRRLGSKLKSAFIKRSFQVAKIKAHAGLCPYPFIISGDFNDTPASYAVNEMAKGLKNAFREKGFGLGRTYNGNFPNYQIDYIMASNLFDIENYQIIEEKLSDHYPVRSDVVLR